MLYIITTTGKCNLKCKYCGGSFSEGLVPYSIKYEIKDLVSKINSDKDATVVYYGGEPLLNWKFIREMNEKLNVKRIGIQTNGTLVENFDTEFWEPFSFALLSIDGDENITDRNRGKGVYRKVIGAAEYLKSLNKELIARMAITGDSSIYNDVMHLINLSMFDKIHWQLDVVWDDPWDVVKFANESYLDGVERLMSIFMENARKGKILKIVPFVGILSAFYFKRFDHFPCGAGKYSITVNTDGRVLACPIAVSEDWNYLGKLGSDLRSINVEEDCRSCSYFGYCGGRCLFSYKERYWGEKGFNDICYITKRTINIVLSKTSELNDLINDGILSKELLYYDPTEDSTEVIP